MLYEVITLFYQSKELPLAISWAETGITMSDDKRFNNVTMHCEGVQYDVGPKREGYVITSYSIHYTKLYDRSP